MKHNNMAGIVLMRAAARARCVWVCALLALPWLGGAQTQSYQSRSITPEHRKALEQSIAECAAKVQATSDKQARAVLQEDLCKRLVQAEDYDNALRVAQTIFETPGVDPERRAAHHYMMAKVYALKMEASPNLALMEQKPSGVVAGGFGGCGPTEVSQAMERAGSRAEPDAGIAVAGANEPSIRRCGKTPARGGPA